MAVFRKLLSTTKNMVAPPATEAEEEDAGAVIPLVTDDTGDIELKTQNWQEELNEMSEFLVLKSSDQQKEEGACQAVDTAYIDTIDGKPILKAVFDTHLFRPDEIHVRIDENVLVLEARATDERDVAIFRKTMLRSLELPQQVDSTLMTCNVSNKGMLEVEIPFQVPSHPRPPGSNVLPITTGPDGRLRIQLTFNLGLNITSDDLNVGIKDKNLLIVANYRTTVGKFSEEKTLRKEFRLPDDIEVYSVHHSLSSDGKLDVEVTLKNEQLK